MAEAAPAKKVSLVAWLLPLTLLDPAFSCRTSRRKSSTSESKSCLSPLLQHPQSFEVFECRRSIAENYSHIKNVEAQLAQLQSQLNLTTGPKKSALEMLRKKIEAKNEQVVAARQKFVSAQKVNALLSDQQRRVKPISGGLVLIQAPELYASLRAEKQAV